MNYDLCSPPPRNFMLHRAPVQRYAPYPIPYTGRGTSPMHTSRPFLSRVPYSLLTQRTSSRLYESTFGHGSELSVSHVPMILTQRDIRTQAPIMLAKLSTTSSPCPLREITLSPPRPLTQAALPLSAHQRQGHHPRTASACVTPPIHYTLASMPLPNRRRKPPEPYSNYANMLADIIGNHRQHKITLQELYELLKERYGDHFSDNRRDDKGNGCGDWKNTIRHALSVNKWFKKQHRTDADAKLDEIDPGHVDPEPVDLDRENVAPATKRSHQTGGFQGGMRPLKGGYWFIRRQYQNEAAKAIMRDKERYNQVQKELLEERTHYKRHGPLN